MSERSDKFTKLTARMMKWAEKNKYPTNPGNPGTDYVIPDHTDRNKSWKEDLKLVTKFESHMELTRVQKLFLNQLWRMYKV
tara:strand:+ start:466 stop:708 length:243 start_codon:yes stop_codon:yes gene_type:complete